MNQTGNSFFRQTVLFLTGFVLTWFTYGYLCAQQDPPSPRTRFLSRAGVMVPPPVNSPGHAPQMEAAPSVEKNAAADELDRELLWRRLFVQQKGISVLPGNFPPEVIVASALRESASMYFKLVTGPPHRPVPVDPFAEGAVPQDPGNDLAGWYRHPVAALTAIQDFHPLPGARSEACRMSAQEAARAAVTFRREDVLNCLANLDPALRDFVSELLNPPAIANTRDESKLLAKCENPFLPLDLRWEALRRWIDLKPEAAENPVVRAQATNMMWSELIAGSSLAELDFKSAALPGSLKRASLKEIVRTAAKTSPYEVSVYVSSLPPKTALRLYGMQILIESPGTDAEAVNAWKAALEKESAP